MLCNWLVCAAATEVRQGHEGTWGSMAEEDEVQEQGVGISRQCTGAPCACLLTCHLVMRPGCSRASDSGTWHSRFPSSGVASRLQQGIARSTDRLADAADGALLPSPRRSTLAPAENAYSWWQSRQQQQQAQKQR